MVGGGKGESPLGREEGENNAFPISRFFSPGDVNINLVVIPRDSRAVTPYLHPIPKCHFFLDREKNLAL